MTINEISKRYNIEIEKLRLFQSNELINIIDDFDEKDLKRLSALCRLYNCGIDFENIKKFMSFDCNKDNKKRLNFLNMYRKDLLDKIHKMEKNLDNLDFMIYKIKNKIQTTF